MDKISIILPFKENFSPSYAGAVSLYVEEINQKSSYKEILMYLVLHYLKKFKTKYTNLNFKNLYFQVIKKTTLMNSFKLKKKNHLY